MTGIAVRAISKGGSPMSSRLPVLVAALVAAVCLTPSAASAQPVETEMPGVTAELVELRLAGGLVRLAIRFTNDSAEMQDTNRFPADRVVLVDVKSKRKHFPLKDANGQFIAGRIGDWINGGRIHLHVPPKQSMILWAFYEPLPAGTVVTVEVPTAFPFENVTVTEGPSKVFAATTARTTPFGATATLVSATRANQTLSVRLRLQADKGVEPRIGESYFEFKDVFLFDPASKRKYPLLKDTEGMFQAQPNTVKMDGGRFIYDWRKTTLVSLTFPAPPDAIQTADLLLPKFLPLEAVKIEGTGGAAAGGVAAAGKTLGLEGALKELNAEVTATEIKVDLSADVLFDVDKSELKPAAEEKLTHLLTVVNSRPASRIAIEGHTDLRGETAYNQALSERRARSVQTWLASHGVAGTRITATGAGESRPVRPGTTDADHQANRRVEIRIRG
jgi:outer membrane protein OmpA-like peptidoglycan-associated protein